MFRHNYLPKGKIYKCSSRNKYFFTNGSSDSFSRKYLYAGSKNMAKQGGYFRVDMLYTVRTYYDSIEDLMTDLYEYAYERHVKDLHNSITHSKGIKV